MQIKRTIFPQAELKSPKGTVATAVIYQSDTFFPSYLTSKVKIAGSSEEKKGVFTDIAEVFNDAEDPSINQVLKIKHYKIKNFLLVFISFNQFSSF